MSGQPWSDQRTNELRDLAARGLTATEASRVMGLTPSTVLGRARRIGLVMHTTRPPPAPRVIGSTYQDGYSWGEHTRRNLSWHYSEARSDAILAGRDPETEADLQRWRSLGDRSGEAA